MLQLNPAEEVIFNQGNSGDLMAKVQATNVAGKPIVFKVIVRKTC